MEGINKAKSEASAKKKRKGQRNLEKDIQKKFKEEPIGKHSEYKEKKDGD